MPRARYGARRNRAGMAPGPQSRRRVLGADTSVTQLVLRLNYHPGHTRVVNAASWHARNTAAGGRDRAVHSTSGRLRLGTPADHAGHEGRGRGGRGGRARQRTRCTRCGPHPARRRGGGDGEFADRGPALGDLAGARLAGPGGAAGVVQPPPGHAAGQPGRDRVPGRGAGARGRARRRPVLLDAVPGRLSAPDRAGLLVQQQSLDRLPRRDGDQRPDQRPGAAARLPGLPQARTRPPGRIRGGVRGRARSGRVLLQRVRDDRRGLRGDHAGLAADHA